jgi:hypothetical protein
MKGVPHVSDIATLPRRASLEELVGALRHQHTRKLDLVVPARALHVDDGQLLIEGTEPVLAEDGVTLTAGAYTPTATCDEGLADKLQIPVAYLRRCRADAPELYAANINTWLERSDASYLVRCMTSDNGGGTARAFLSNSYKIVDNLDVLFSVLDGIRTAGVPVNVAHADLTDHGMYVQVVCEQIAVMAPELLAGYRSPWNGQSADDLPVVFAGLKISNSEVGAGAATITPSLTVQVCSNGLTISRDALRTVHLGSRLDDGVITWSSQTQAANLQLIRSKAADAVTSFLSIDYLQAKVDQMTRLAGKPIDRPERTIRHLGKKLGYSEDTQNSILSHFIRGGQLTAGGVMQAITSVAQGLGDADAAHLMEGQALEALELAASH